MSCGLTRCSVVLLRLGQRTYVYDHCVQVVLIFAAAVTLRYCVFFLILFGRTGLLLISKGHTGTYTGIKIHLCTDVTMSHTHHHRRY
jgi:hypothetical protein